MGTTVFVASGKGGVGKSTLVTGLAVCLASMGAEVLCIDADAGIRSLDLLLGVTDRTSLDLGDVLRGDVPLEKAAVRHGSVKNLSLLNAPVHEGDIDPDALARLMRSAGEKYDYVLVDCAAGAGDELRGAARRADLGIIIAAPEPASIRGAERAATVAAEGGGSELTLRLVLNRVRPELLGKRGVPNVDDAIDGVGARLLGIIPEDARVSEFSVMGRIPVLEGVDGASGAMLRIARRLGGERVPLPNMKKW